MPGKFKIVVSDLHLGAGLESEGNRLEDFGSDLVFATFLAELAAESDRHRADVELIINGDGFEMLQVPALDHFDPDAIYPPEQYHPSSEADSVRKMALIVEGHRPLFEALKAFIQVGPPRRSVTFVMGNHDLNLYWRGVRSTIRQALATSGERSSLLGFEKRCINREGIYVEHGNQYAEIVDRVQDMDNPVYPDRPAQLAMPLGSWFVMNVLNRFERERYWIDGVKPITALVWYALAFDFSFAVRAIAMLLGALPSVLWDGLLGLEEARAAELSRQAADEGRVAQWSSRYETDEAFRAQFNRELAELFGVPLDPSLAAADAAAAADNPVAAGDQVRRQVNSSLFQAAARCAMETGAKLVTFGHTHEPGVEQLPTGGVYINSGTWTWRADFGQEGKETWRDLFAHPERFTQDRLLSYVRIDYDEAGQPVGTLRVRHPGEGALPLTFPETLASLWHQAVRWLQELWTTLTGGD